MNHLAAQSTKKPKHARTAHARAKAVSGLTLVELLVAVTISAVIAIAAISALTISRQGFTAVDAAAQLRDNARFATDLIEKLGVQAGFRDVFQAASKPGNNEPRDVFGFNNQLSSPSDPFNSSTNRPANQAGLGSDVLILSYQPALTVPQTHQSPGPGPGVIDNSMIDCMGNAAPAGPDGSFTSVLHVDVSNDSEPNLMCSVGPGTSQPILSGVENFQVLYGVDNVTPNAALGAANTRTFVATRYLRADQMTVTGNDVATNANWLRVRALRIGMVLRGPVGSSSERVTQTFYPLGQEGMSSANDIGTAFVAPADGRLRQVVSFTVHLRNVRQDSNQ